MKFDIYKLHFETPLHIGDYRADYGVSLKTIQSDTMYAAVTACLAKAGISIPDNGDLGCTITSLFPFKGDTLYFPKPLSQGIPSGATPENLKSFKKVSWIEKTYFERTINGENIFPATDIGHHIDGDYLAEDIKEHKPDIRSSVSPRVTVSRDYSEEARPFYMDRLYFGQNSGLFFMATGNTTLLEKGLNLLQHEGIGTDRNVGNGYFTYSKEELTLTVPESTARQMTLSVFIPNDKEQLHRMLDNASYDLFRRGGWITTHPYNTLRKNHVHAFSPASVFSAGNGTVHTAGAILNLKPKIEGTDLKHCIWRCGRAIFIPTL